MKLEQDSKHHNCILPIASLNMEQKYAEQMKKGYSEVISSLQSKFISPIGYAIITF